MSTRHVIDHNYHCKFDYVLKLHLSLVLLIVIMMLGASGQVRPEQLILGALVDIIIMMMPGVCGRVGPEQGQDH